MNIGQEGLPITIYARGWKTRIAEVTLVGRSSTVGLTRHVRVKLDLTCKEKIYAKTTFRSCVLILMEQLIGRYIFAAELLTWLMLASQFKYMQSNISVGFRIDPITDSSNQTNHDGDNDAQNEDFGGAPQSSESSSGETDERTRLPRSLRRRLRRFKVSSIL